MREKPGRFLRDPQVAMELHARYALETGHDQERGDNPVLIADLRPFHDGTGLGAESLRAKLFPAAERHGLVLAAKLYIQRSAMRAANTLRPALPDDPFLSLEVGGELSE